MDEVATIEMDAEKINLLNAQLDRFGELLDITSAKLPNYVEEIAIAAKRVHLETESLRGIKESLNVIMAETLRKEINALATPLGNELFSTFSGKATTFFDNKFSSLSRVNDGLKKTIHTWSNLSFKSIGLLALASMLIGIATFFSCYYLMPSQRLTKDEMNFMYYGQVFALNHKKFSPEINRFFIDEANKLMKTKIVIANGD